MLDIERIYSVCVILMNVFAEHLNLNPDFKSKRDEGS